MARWNERDHPRDGDGRFTDSWVGRISDRLGQQRGTAQPASAAEGRDAFRAIRSLESTRWAGYYQGEGHKAINKGLRRGDWDSSTVRGRAQEFIDDIENREVQRPVVLYRGIRYGQGTFGNLWNDEDMIGVEWSEPGLSSLTAREDVAQEFTFKVPIPNMTSVVMRILVPEGTGAGSIGNWAQEAEVVLAPTKYRVVADRGIINGKRHLDVEVVPKNG